MIYIGKSIYNIRNLLNTQKLTHNFIYIHIVLLWGYKIEMDGKSSYIWAMKIWDFPGNHI